MRCIRFTSSILLCMAMVGAAQAGGLIRKLPEDGTWARYSAEGALKDKNGKTRISNQDTVTISSVGRETVNGEACRWIEFEMAQKVKPDKKPGDVVELYRFLIPEKYLTSDSNPLEHVLDARALRKTQEPNGDTKEIDPTFSLEDYRFEALAPTFQPPLPNVTRLEAKEMETKLGKLPCPGEKGDNGFGFTTEVRWHDKAPFGVVSYSYELPQPKDRTASMTFRLVDFGQGAKSKFPKGR